MKSLQHIIKEYKTFLLKTHSPNTVRNYLADINHFANWFNEYYEKQFNTDLLNKNTIYEYKRLRGASSQTSNPTLSEETIKRHLSSLRSFCAYLKEFEEIPENPFEAIEAEKSLTEDDWGINKFRQYLLDKDLSDLTIKYYINDISGFKKWIEQSNPSLETIKNPAKIITEDIISEYKYRLTSVLLLSPLSINRKLSSIRNYLSFLKIELEKKFIPNISKATSPLSSGLSLSELTVEAQEEKIYSSNPVIKSIQKLKDLYLDIEERTAKKIADGIIKSRVNHVFKPRDYDKKIQTIDEVLRAIKFRNLEKEFYSPYSIPQDSPLHKKIFHHLRHSRPKWYKEYHKYPFVHYFHLGTLVIAAVVAGFYIYNGTLGRVKANSELQSLNPYTKILTFKGRVLDKEGNPVTQPIDIRFGLYTSPTEGDSTLIWKETQNNITPSNDGSVNLILGSITPIPRSLADSETPLYLGVKIGDADELTPRKQIGPAFASNTHAVQGMLPITSSDSQRNVLLALDGSGNLSIGGVANPVFQATGGSFTFSGETLILATNPSSNGNILIRPDGNGKIEVGRAIITNETGVNFGLQNVVEIEGGLGISATSSAHAALILNQNSRGELISASTGGLGKFIVDNQGAIIKGAWAGDFIPTQYGGLGGSVTAAGPGELLYSISTTKYSTLKAGIYGQCLISQGSNSPIWSSCGGLTQINGTLLTSNNTLDLLIGAESTTSAKFAFINMNSGTPTLKIGSALGIDTNGIIQAYNNRDLFLGGSSTKNILLASSGNVGIGTTDPKRSFDLTGTFGGNVELFIDGQGTRTINIASKALVYDLEKSTGISDTDGTTTYNITGLPDVNGTIAYIYLKVSKGITANPRSQSINVQINGTYIANVSTPTNWAAEEEIKHMTVVRSNNIWHVQGSPGTNNAADIAEWTEFEGETPKKGEIVSISYNGKLIKSQKAHDVRLAGVISTKPNITIGPQTRNSARLALSGRIPVIVTTISGDVKAGDPITSSDIPGVGMKPKRNSPIIGKALSSFPQVNTCKETSSIESISWPEDDGTNNNNPCFKISVSSLPFDVSEKILSKYGITSADYIYIGKVLVLAGLNWSQEDNFQESLEAVSITEEGAEIEDESLSNLMSTLQGKTYAARVGEKIIEEIGAFSTISAGVVKSGIVTTKDATIEGFLAVYNIVADKITSYEADIKRLTAGKIKADEIISPLAKLDTIKTEKIEPSGKDLAVKLHDNSEFQIKNGENEIVTTFDGEGNINAQGNITAQNATVSGNINSNNASISGTLRAGKLIANDIDGLSERVSNFADIFLSDFKKTASLPLYELGEPILAASVSASFGTFHHGLISLGPSTFGSITAIDQISVGTDFIFSNGSINSIGRTLEIQPLRQAAISLMAGSVNIEPDGRLIVSNDAIFAKNVTIAGDLIAKTFSPFPGQNISVNLQGSNFEIKNATESAVFSVNPTGDVSASGSGTFSKLNFQLVGEAIAANDLEAYATTSAGTAFLKAYRPELTIYNNKVTEKSLIYITPKNNTDNNVIFLLRQTPNQSFTVGVSKLIGHDVEFNWLIVN